MCSWLIDLMKIDFLYIAGGKLHLKLYGAPFRLISSEFGQATQERVLQIRRRNLFRNQGFMANRLPPQMLKQMEEKAHTPTPVNFNSVCCDSQGKIYYALNVGEVGGVFTLDSDRIQEKRLFHGSDFLLQQLTINDAEQLIACTAEQKDGTANIAIMPINGAMPHQITEGDSIDTAPCWIPHKRKALVYQSAGIARNRQGFACDRSPFRLEELDFERSEINCLLEDPAYDFLQPKMAEDGTLFYIRRPYNPQREPTTFWSIVKDLLMLPLRLANTLYQILNFFALSFTGKPLMKVGEVQPSNTQQKINIWGELIDLQKISQGKNRKEKAIAGLVPNSWQLIRQVTPTENQVIAEGVLYYDLASDGSILYTNGNSIYHLTSFDAQPERLFEHKLIEQLAIAKIK